MKKIGVKQMILGIIGSMICGVGIMGDYPIVPAYFAALLLEGVSTPFLFAMMYIGMMLFMPLEVLVKYVVILVTIAVMIKLMEWANRRCPSGLAGVFSGISVIVISFGGILMDISSQTQTAFIFLEGVFTVGGTILLSRVFHQILMAQPQTMPVEVPERGNEEKLRGYAESFQGLSKIFYSMSQKKNSYTPEELGRIQNEITGKLCGACDSCAICWEQEVPPFSRALGRLIQSLLERGEPGEEEKELEKYCTKSHDMVEEAIRVFQRVDLNHAWYNRLLENRHVIAEQLDAMAYILQDCAKEEKNLDQIEKRKLRELQYRAKECGIMIEGMHLSEQEMGYRKLEVTLKSKTGGCISIKQFLGAAEAALGMKLRLAADSKTFIGRELFPFILYEDTLFRCVHGIARMKKDGAQISGDNFSFLELEQGEQLLGLSDGMGSGSMACKESEMVLDLLERFLEAGFSVETAIRMMNSAMVMREDDNTFSTVDLCKINLYSGQAILYKIGAAATFVKTKEGVTCIASANLPVGVEAEPEITEQELQLKNGDFVVMVTDGVLEYLHVPKPEQTMQEMIESIATNNPGILAKRIMERVMLFTGGKAKDDMTVLTACVWEK